MSDCPQGGGPNGCESCRMMCDHGYPGRFHPREAKAAIDAGHAGGLMLTIENGSGAIHAALLRPAIVGWEGLALPESQLMRGQCVFMTAAGGCQLHTSGFKPTECAMATCASSVVQETRADQNRMRAALCRAWKTKMGQAVIAEWTKLITSESDNRA